MVICKFCGASDAQIAQRFSVCISSPDRQHEFFENEKQNALIVEGATELDQFKAFFDLMGVTCSQWKKRTAIDEGVLAVAQAIFYFDENGTYLRVEDDEMGGVYPRKKP